MIHSTTENTTIQDQELRSKLNWICKKIAPLWSLENFVAVNPYLGLANYKFEDAMSLLSKRGNVKATLPLEFYLEAIAEGKINKADIQETLINKQHRQAETPEAFLSSLSPVKSDDAQNAKMKTVLDISETMTGKNWNRFMVERISEWGATYFDKNQASWKTASSEGIFKAWKLEASIDKTPEVTGLVRF